MNPISNLEIINFDELNYNQQSIDLEQEIGLNYIDNFIMDKYNSEYSESQSDLNNYDSPCNVSFCSDNNSIFLNNKVNLNYSSPNLHYTEQTACSENFKTPSFSESSRGLEKIMSNSFSYLRKSAKFKLSNDRDLNGSNLIGGPNRNFACTYENCEPQ